MRVLALVLALAGTLAADEPLRLRSRGEFWNWFFWEAVDTGKFRIRGVGQFRSQPHLDTFLRSQGGPILEWQVSEHWNTFVGYYFQEFRGSYSDPELRGAHRPFGGFEYAFKRKNTGIETRQMYEFFKGTDGIDSARTRHRLRFDFPGPLGPFALQEFFVDRRGVQASRSEAGISYQIAPRLQIQLTYFHEYRPERSGGTRDVVNTRIIFRGPWAKK
jgi:hypothetical protein